MRVGIDYRPALVGRDGIGRYTRELVRALVELSFDGNLALFGYTLTGSDHSQKELGIAGSRAELLRLRIPSKWVPWILRKQQKGVDDLVGGVDVYHHTQFNRLVVRQAVEVAMIHDCIYMLNADYLETKDAERITGVARELAQNARRILVPSEYVGADVVMNLGVFPNRITVTPLGCDHIARSIPPEGFPPAREPYLLTVSRVDGRKNHVRMLQAFERLVQEGFPHRWIVAGSAGYGCEHFKRALADSPVKNRVEWRGRTSEKDLARLYAQASLLLFASLNEGFGIPSLEAMAAGAPVVTSCITAMPEVAGDAALLVEPTDVDQIFEAARSILAEPELAKEKVAQGQARARQFTWRETARHTLLAYRRALEPEEADGPKLRRSL